MKSNLLWKFLFVVFVVAFAVNEAWPPVGRPLLDVFEERAINTDDAFKAITARARELQQGHSDRSFGNLWDAVGTNDLSRYFPTIPTTGETDVNRAILQRLQKEASGKIKLGLDIQGGSMFVVGVDTSKADTEDGTGERERLLSQAVEVLRKRVDKFGVAEPVIQPQGTDRIIIQMPGLAQEDLDRVIITLQKAAVLEFRLVHPQSDSLIEQGIPEPGYEIMIEKGKDRKGQEYTARYLVSKKPERGLTGKYIESAMASRDPITGKPLIYFTFNNEGAVLFGEVTRANIGNKLAIVLDGNLESAPVIQSEITKSGQITGNYSLKEAIDLAGALENPLETPVSILHQSTVDPSLGKDSIKSGVKATLIGLIAVVVFMLIYYLLAGLVANVALCLNIIILLGVFCHFDATLTIPGIAGILLTIGMAVDANVLIFERMREEFAAGKSIRGAISAGYDRAFSTVLDTNLTTLISSLILIKLGTGPVKGFGVTLTIGVAASMFTALVVTRLIFDFLLERGMLKSLPMLRLIGKTKIDFLRWAKPAFVASWLLVLAGTGYGLSRGVDVLGVDLRGGDSINLAFTERVDVDQLRATIEPLGFGAPQIQYQRDLGSGKETLQILTGFESGQQVFSALQQAHPGASFSLLSIDQVGPAVSQEILTTAAWAMLFALFGILVYVAFRYEFSFAVAAIIAILHDVLMTAGWFCLCGLFGNEREFSAPMVAAILTIIGFSINDTIVIFDRIREDLQLGLRGSFKEIINTAINQTLARTLITSGTTFLATAALYVFGGGVINDFAFTFLVGIITGTYSTIYIASAIVLWWHKGKRPAIGGPVGGAGVQVETPAVAKA
jgi:SecD/SecF fusion protein